MVIAALGTNVEIALDFLAEDDFAASGTFHPDVIVRRVVRRLRRCEQFAPLLPHLSTSVRGLVNAARRAHRILHRAHCAADSLEQAWSRTFAFDDERQCAAHRNAVGVAGNLRRLRGSRNAESHGYREGGHGTERRYASLETRGKGGTGAGDAGDRDVIEKSAACASDSASALDRGRRREQMN